MPVRGSSGSAERGGAPWSATGPPGVAVARLRGERLELEQVDDGAVVAFGRTRESLVGEGGGWLAEGEVQRVLDHARRLTPGAAGASFETVIARGDGTRAPAALAMLPLHDGRLALLIQAQPSRDRGADGGPWLRGVVDVLGAAALVVTDARVLVANARAAVLLGYDEGPAHVEGRSARELVDEDGIAALHEAAARAGVVARSIALRRRDGGLVPVALTAVAAEHEGAGALVCIAHALGPACEPEAAPASRRPRVLVIDDEPAVARSVRALLSRDHEVELAHDAAHAIERLLADASFDAVLCDLMMPGTTGMDVHERLERERPGLEQRVVYMTGGAFTPRARAFLERVPNPRLEKPFSLQDLDAALHAVLHSAHS